PPSPPEGSISTPPPRARTAPRIRATSRARPRSPASGCIGCASGATTTSCSCPVGTRPRTFSSCASSASAPADLPPGGPGGDGGGDFASRRRPALRAFPGEARGAGGSPQGGPPRRPALRESRAEARVGGGIQQSVHLRLAEARAHVRNLGQGVPERTRLGHRGLGRVVHRVVSPLPSDLFPQLQHEGLG